jgi:hypothetical protein
MSIEATRVLKQTFFDEYGSFADTRIKKLDSGSLFIIDDRNPRKDFDAKEHPFPWFCLMSADVADQDTVLITLRGGDGVLVSPGVTAWLDAHGARRTNSDIQFDVKRGSQGKISGLATAVRAAVKQRDRPSSYYFTCPRVGSALDRVRAVLDRAWP